MTTDADPQSPLFTPLFTLAQIRQLVGDPNFEFDSEYKPCASYYPAMDMLLYLERDVSYTSQWVPGSNIELLYENHDDGMFKLVGVKINQFSMMVPKAVIDAYREKDVGRGQVVRDGAVPEMPR